MYHKLVKIKAPGAAIATPGACVYEKKLFIFVFMFCKVPFCLTAFLAWFAARLFLFA